MKTEETIYALSIYILYITTGLRPIPPSFVWIAVWELFSSCEAIQSGDYGPPTVSVYEKMQIKNPESTHFPHHVVFWMLTFPRIIRSPNPYLHVSSAQRWQKTLNTKFKFFNWYKKKKSSSINLTSFIEMVFKYGRQSL